MAAQALQHPAACRSIRSRLADSVGKLLADGIIYQAANVVLLFLTPQVPPLQLSCVRTESAFLDTRIINTNLIFFASCGRTLRSCLFIFSCSRLHLEFTLVGGALRFTRTFKTVLGARLSKNLNIASLSQPYRWRLEACGLSL